MSAKMKKKHFCTECGNHFPHGIGLRKHQRHTGHRGNYITRAPFHILGLPDATRISNANLLRVLLLTATLSLVVLLTRLMKHQLGPHSAPTQSLFEPATSTHGVLEFTGFGLLALFFVVLVALGRLWQVGSWSEAPQRLAGWRIDLLSGALLTASVASYLNWLHLEANWFISAFALTVSAELWVGLIPERDIPPDPQKDGFVLAEIATREARPYQFGHRSSRVPRKTAPNLVGFHPKVGQQISLEELRTMLRRFRSYRPTLTKLAQDTMNTEELLTLWNCLHHMGQDVTKLEPILDGVVFGSGSFQERVRFCVERIKIYEIR